MKIDTPPSASTHHQGIKAESLSWARDSRVYRLTSNSACRELEQRARRMDCLTHPRCRKRHLKTLGRLRLTSSEGCSLACLILMAISYTGARLVSQMTKHGLPCGLIFLKTWWLGSKHEGLQRESARWQLYHLVPWPPHVRQRLSALCGPGSPRGWPTSGVKIRLSILAEENCQAVLKFWD